MKARIHVEKDFRIGQVDPRLFSSFIEHLGRAVYGGIYEPGHPEADEEGFRGDVLSIVRELRLPLVRYPGGNFVNTLRWEDTVGPRESRPRRLDPAWRSLETNAFGLDEFLSWTKKAGTSPMMTVNLGTRGIEASRNLVEYCNIEGGSAWSDLRRSNGAGKPYDIGVWCLGNEMDGPWQVGQKSAAEYGRLANEAGKAMRLVDPSIELVAAGSSMPSMPGFPSWDAEVLELCWDQADYLSLHSYYDDRAGDLGDYLASSAGMDAFIRSVVATCDHVRAKKRGHKTMMLSFDEWNVWFRTKPEDRDREPWTLGPRLLEEDYGFEDALAVACLLISLLRNADRVKIACLAQLVNALAPIRTENGGRVWRQSIFWPFLHASLFGRGDALLSSLECPRYESRRFGEVPWLEAIAVAGTDDSGGERLTLFAVNRHESEPIDLSIAAGGFDDLVPVERIEYARTDFGAAPGSEGRPPRHVSHATENDSGRTRLRLAPLTWNVVGFGTRRT